MDVPLTARLLSNGTPVAGSMVNYQVLKGSGTLSSSRSTSDSNGFANTSLHLPSLAGDAQVSACLAPGNKPCQIFSATAVPASSLQLQPVAGSVQVLPAGQAFQPVTVRVSDFAMPSHPVAGANVTFQFVVSRLASDAPPVSIGGIVITRNPSPVIVSSSQVSVMSDATGLATVQPSAGGAQGAMVIQGAAAAGASILQFHLQSFLPVADLKALGTARRAESGSK